MSCLTDGVEWLISRLFHVHGKKEYGGQITNDAYVGLPEVTIVQINWRMEIIG